MNPSIFIARCKIIIVQQTIEFAYNLER